MNAPKTDFQRALRKVTASPTEKKKSPRSCSTVIFEATVLARKKMHAKLIVPIHIAMSVICVSSTSLRGGVPVEVHTGSKNPARHYRLQ